MVLQEHMTNIRLLDIVKVAGLDNGPTMEGLEFAESKQQRSRS